MKQPIFQVICKIILIVNILSTPIRYAVKSHKTAQKIDVLEMECKTLNDSAVTTTADIKRLVNETERMKSEIDFMRSQVNKKIQ
jgi:predicted  nucleic acid-binding Zn-ribbon protein